MRLNGIAFALYLFSSVALGEPVYIKNFEYGKIGDIQIGMRLQNLENKIGHPLEVNVMGANQYGVLINNNSDLKKLRLNKILNNDQDEVELIFRDNTDELKHISVELPCQIVKKFNPKLHVKKKKIIDSYGSWIATNDEFRYGRILSPVCHIFIGSNKK